MKSGILFGLSLFMVIVALVSFSSVRADISDSATSVLNVSLVNQNPDPAPAGEMVELRFMVENVGGKESNNVVFELIPQYPFVAIPGEDYVKTINTISAYQQGTDAIILKFRVRVDKDAVKGTNEISLKRTDPSGISITNKYDIEVSGNEFAQIIYIDKAKLEPGNETPLRFTITNVETRHCIIWFSRGMRRTA